jgi:hypothetical protein
MAVTPIGSSSDGTQIWKITHNGVDTHPIHFHLYDVQLLNRVTWDNIIIPPDANELGWKDTVRMSPLEDTIVALRPVIPTLPFDVPNSIRLLNPMLPDGAPIALASVSDALGVGIPPSNPAGEPVDIYNHKINFGWEYVWHCHILSHEEMDMMRPVALALPPLAPVNLAATVAGNGKNKKINLAWTDTSRSETAFEVQRATSTAGPWTSIATLQSATGPAIDGTVTYSDPVGTDKNSYAYRVRAVNVVGDTWNYADPGVNEIVSGGFPNVSAYSGFSNSATTVTPPAAPSNLTATILTATQVRLNWTDNAGNESGFVIQRSVNGGAYAALTQLASNTVTFTDTTAASGNTYGYQVAAVNPAGTSALSNTASVVVAVPVAPSVVTATAARANGNNDTVTLRWTDNSNNETGFTIQRAGNANFTGTITTSTAAANATSFAVTGLARNTQYYFRIRATNAVGASAAVNAAPFPILTP